MCLNAFFSQIARLRSWHTHNIGIILPVYEFRKFLIPNNPTYALNTFYFRKELGKVRLNIQLFEEHILPWECYVPLINLLVETVKKQPYDEHNTLGLLEQVMTADRTAIGRALIKLYLNQGMIVKLLDALTKVEVLNTGRYRIFVHLVRLVRVS